MKIKINNEFKNLIPPLSKEEIEGLKESIKKEGVRDPLIVWNDILVDGHNRKEIADSLNLSYKTKNKNFKDINEAKIWIINNQLVRRNLSKYDRGILELKREEILKPIAEKNQKAGRPLDNIDKRLNVRKEIAKASGLGEGTIHKIKFIEKNATKEIKQKLSKGEETINKVYTNLKRKEKVKQIQKELVKPKPITKKYEIIYSDPAWEYNRKVGEGIVNEQYNLSSLEEIKNIPVKKITEDNAVLFLWVTFPMLKEGLEVMESWGFKYKTCGFNWIKLNKNGKAFFGIGHYTKSNSELCLLGIKGKGLPVLDNTISQIIMTQKDKHSKKPSEVRDLIVKLFGNRKRIELFAREKIEGWDVYGDQIK